MVIGLPVYLELLDHHGSLLPGHGLPGGVPVLAAGDGEHPAVQALQGGRGAWAPLRRGPGPRPHGDGHHAAQIANSVASLADSVSYCLNGHIVLIMYAHCNDIMCKDPILSLNVNVCDLPGVLRADPGEPARPDHGYGLPGRTVRIPVRVVDGGGRLHIRHIQLGNASLRGGGGCRRRCGEPGADGDRHLPGDHRLHHFLSRQVSASAAQGSGGKAHPKPGRPHLGLLHLVPHSQRPLGGRHNFTKICGIRQVDEGVGHAVVPPVDLLLPPGELDAVPPPLLRGQLPQQGLLLQLLLLLVSLLGLVDGACGGGGGGGEPVLVDHRVVDQVVRVTLRVQYATQHTVINK